MSDSRTTVSFTTYGGSAPENYERYFVPAIGEPVARDLIDRAGLRAGERVLDVACGTGIVTRLAAEQVGQTGTVAGLDLNPGMLAVARSVTPPEVSIDWHEASAEAIPLPDDTLDVVLCGMGLQFMADKPAALREMRRVLAPGGRLVLNAPGPTPPPLAVMAEALATHVRPEVAGFVHAVFSLHDAEELRGLLEGAGFADVVVDRPLKTLRLPPPQTFLWQYVHSTPLAGAVAQTDEEARAALEQHMVAGCEPYVDNGALIADVRMLTAIARRTAAGSVGGHPGHSGQTGP
ncbi:MAG: methyltransferase domain-containing protein [Nitriliruptorales bacterium]|nr:methyltransferase domain-containing protein [Nitriliruptorales bacterium]